MAFLKRLGWYLMGLSIGIIFLVFFLKKKSGEDGIDFCYMPNCRVLKDIRSKQFDFKGQKGLQFEGLDSLTQYILKNGNVDFKRSETKTKPCKTYFVEDPNSENYVLKIENCPEKATIRVVH